MRAVFLLILSTLFINACTSVGSIRPLLSTDINYQKDLHMRVSVWDGKKWGQSFDVNGMGIIPKAQGYKILVYPPGKADMITVLSCHREWKTPNPEKQGGWFSKGHYEFEIWPTEEHEAEKICSFDAGVYEKSKGRHAWGLLVVESQREKLGATVKCNGETRVFGGTSVCQAKEGLIESIHFDRPVLATEVPGCVLTPPKDKRNWIFTMPKNECVVFFVDEKNHEMLHKFVLYGYDTIPIRGVD